MLLTDNNNGDVKVRAVLNDKQARIWTTKENTASPSAVNEINMIFAAIDAKEGKFIIGVDVPNTFIY